MIFMEEGISPYLEDHTKLHLFMPSHEKIQEVWIIKLSSLVLVCWKTKKKIMSEYRVTQTTESQQASLPTNTFLQPSPPQAHATCAQPPAPAVGRAQAGLRAAAAGSPSAFPSSLCRCNYCGWPNVQWLFPLLGDKAASCFILKALPSRALVFCILDSSGKTQTVLRGHLQPLHLAANSMRQNEEVAFLAYASWLQSKHNRTPKAASCLDKYSKRVRNEHWLTFSWIPLKAISEKPRS